MLKIVHVDMNFRAFRPDSLKAYLQAAADAGANAILWELEDKIAWETCPEVVSPDHFTKAEFRELLAFSKSLNLEAIPLLQTIGHGEYVLMKKQYAAFRELPDRYDCYCTTNPDVRAFFKKWIAEFFDLFGAVRFFHIGGDEAYQFGSCPECSKHGQNELYGEYISDLGEEIRKHGARACIWGDMILHDAENLSRIPNSFVIWDWVYSQSYEPNAFSSTELLRKTGFELVLCSSTQCYGDDPFLVRWPNHFDNATAAAFRCAQTPPLLGNCVTSWSIRLAPKSLQPPLMKCAFDALSGRFPPEKREEIYHSLLIGTFGSDNPALAAALGDGIAELLNFTAMGWSRFKDSLPPPPGFLESKLRLIERENLTESAIEHAREIRRRLKDAIQCLESVPEKTPQARTLLTGMKLKERYLKIGEALLTGDIAAVGGPAAVMLLGEDLERYYAEEETRRSAAKNAAQVIAPILNYLEEKGILA